MQIDALHDVIVGAIWVGILGHRGRQDRELDCVGHKGCFHKRKRFG